MSTIVGTNIEVTNIKFDSDTTAMIVSSNGGGAGTVPQGLVKFWMQTRGDLITANIQDSFNSSTVTDIGTGFIDTNFTNNMGNVNYAMSNCGMNGDHIVNSTDYTLAASCRFAHYNQSNSAADPGIAGYMTAGDLA